MRYEVEGPDAKVWAYFATFIEAADYAEEQVKNLLEEENAFDGCFSIRLRAEEEGQGER